MLSYFGGNSLVGYYQSGMKVIVALTVIPLIFDSSYFPLLSENSKDRIRFSKISYSLIEILFSIGLPMMVCIVMLADKIIITLYGKTFTESVVILQILSIVLFLKFLIRGYETMLISIGKQNIILKIIAIAIIINVLINSFIIPISGVIGVASVAVVTHSFVLLMYLYIVRCAKYKLIIGDNEALLILPSLLSTILIYHLQFLNLVATLMIFILSNMSFYFLIFKKKRMWIVKEIGAISKLFNTSNRKYRL